MEPIIEGSYPVFIEPPGNPKTIVLRIGKQEGRGESQTTEISLSQGRLLAYALLREVEERHVYIERLNEEAKSGA